MSMVEFADYFAQYGQKKVKYPPLRLFILAIVGGLLIALGGLVAAIASHAIHNYSITRVVSGLLFPFGLIMIILSSAELFTSNCLLFISVLDKKISILKACRNLVIVYIGNFVGAISVSYMASHFGVFDLSHNELAAYALNNAVGKTNLSISQMIILGIFCNILVCFGSVLAYSAKDTVSKAIGAYLPVAFFIICGFEHSIANMYYITAGLFSLNNPAYVSMVDTIQNLTWLSFANNLLFVTIGNIIGGFLVSFFVWYCFKKSIQH